MGRRLLYVRPLPAYFSQAFYECVVAARANFAEEEEIQELVRWTHPHLSSSPETFQYTEMENATMLRLPRKECGSFAFSLHLYVYHKDIFQTSPPPSKRIGSTTRSSPSSSRTPTMRARPNTSPHPRAHGLSAPSLPPSPPSTRLPTLRHPSQTPRYRGMNSSRGRTWPRP